ncbi:MAG: Unknown protein [uncultured Sulfurovum sp.]|uniref:Uncharacterized protein n=1 Tax=uncultured Sulfurovum sp. TaxID=269237 RepID=A0A6S6TZ28_9BACT|nr:MAG: Unknown protein [uncultured Sulfurovum sp.]
MRPIVLVLLLINFSLLIIGYFLVDARWLLNSQVAFISSSLVMIASMYAHQKMVTKAILAKAISDDGRDVLDKLEDPYDLYDESKQVNEEEKSLEEIVKEERLILKKHKRSFWQTSKDAKTSFSLYRLFAYLILVLGFFYLTSTEQLRLTPYLSFLSLPPIIIVYLLLKNR